ncbi:MAG: PQQ-binding-like beta-propeller repeat protein [Acidobacteriota bacterium]|nr:PQQ-binding-like beta-propeller repeat protein [Blastocatellia bacterium]MDW8238272.1 PQQ-binding-like beta-propeller repeat protein [Acidobacteriota bacterium]
MEHELGVDKVTHLHLRWEFEAGSGVTATPAVVGSHVVIGSWDGRVYALDRYSGKLLWVWEAGTRQYAPDRRLGIFASPAIDSNAVYIASDRVIALDLTRGQPLWETVVGDPDNTGEYFWAPPLVHGRRLYAGISCGREHQSRGRVVCLDSTTGRLLWNFFTVAEDVAGGAVFAAPSLDIRTRTVYVATGSPFRVRPGRLRHSCSLIALDADTGKLRWADQVIPPDLRNLDLNCPPMLLTVVRGRRQQRLIVVGGKDGIRAWDQVTRRRLWRVQLTPAIPPGGTESVPTSGPETGPTATADGLVFFASNNHQDRNCVIAALEAVTGDIVWMHTCPAFQFGPMSVANGVVYLGLTDGKLRAWRASDGQLLWESSAYQPIAAGPAIAHAMVFIGTGAGQYLPGNKLLAFGLRR